MCRLMVYLTSTKSTFSRGVACFMAESNILEKLLNNKPNSSQFLFIRKGHTIKVCPHSHHQEEGGVKKLLDDVPQSSPSQQ